MYHLKNTYLPDTHLVIFISSHEASATLFFAYLFTKFNLEHFLLLGIAETMTNLAVSSILFCQCKFDECDIGMADGGGCGHIVMIPLRHIIPPNFLL